MRKTSFIVLVLVAFAAAPAMASVTLSGTTSGTTYTINYSISGPNSVRAFALDITVNNSKTISSVDCSRSSYYVYPGGIAISGGSVTSWGSCVCDATKYPGKGQGGTGTFGVSVEMGSLYASGGTKPATSGTLLSFVVSATPCTATVSANPARGGVVMENPDESAGSNLPFSFPAAQDCLKSTASEYNAWNSWGKPDCWCYTHQCKGDADNTRTGQAWVATSDLNLFRTAYNKNYTVLTQLMGSFGGKPICSDFDHTNTGVIRVATSDLNIFRTSYNKNQTLVRCCDADNNCTLAAGDKWNSWKP